MTLSDLHSDQIAHLLNTRNPLVVRYTRAKVQANAENYFVRLNNHGNVVAFVEAARLQWYQVEVRHLTVAPDQERQGHARALLTEVEAKARARGERLLQCTIRDNNLPSRSLFESVGFRRVSRFFNANGGKTIDVFQKVLSLPPDAADSEN